MVRVYLACSLDGFVAGPEHDLEWLHETVPDAPPADPGALGFEAFLGECGAMLMGRTTYDVVRGFGAWPYGELPVHVATHRPLDPEPPATVRAVAGSIDALLDEALAVAGGRDVYLDGGALVRSALDADRIDELVITWVPVLLGQGVPLWQGLVRSHKLRFEAVDRFEGGLVQVKLRRRHG